MQADPLNSLKFPEEQQVKDPFSYRSILRLAQAPNLPPINQITIAPNQLSYQSFYSQILQNQRQIAIYTPLNFNPNDPNTTLLFVFDGMDYINKVKLPQILAYLQQIKAIPPVVAIFIDNPSMATRATELPNNPAFATMLASELYPWVKQQLNLVFEPAQTGVVGSSFGGLAAAYVAQQYPHIFTHVIALSGSFWWPAVKDSQEKSIIDLYLNSPKSNIRFFISAGLYEDGNSTSILASSRHLKDVLIAKGYQVNYQEYAADHSYFAWQYILTQGLELLKNMDD